MHGNFARVHRSRYDHERRRHAHDNPGDSRVAVWTLREIAALPDSN
jgi:hypothetical protein